LKEKEEVKLLVWTDVSGIESSSSANKKDQTRQETRFIHSFFERNPHRQLQEGCGGVKMMMTRRRNSLIIIMSDSSNNNMRGI